MALAHRVNTNYTPLLNTFYCKCIVNVRFKTKGKQKSRNTMSDLDEPENRKTFDQVLKLRQSQATRSILVKVCSFDRIKDVQEFIKERTNVVNMFPYRTINDDNFVLMELETANDVQNLTNIAYLLPSADHASPVTPMYLYYNLHNLKSESTRSLNFWTYSAFRQPTVDYIRKKIRSAPRNPSNHMAVLWETLKMSEINHRLRFYTANMLSYYISKLIVNMTVVPFGSTMNGFGQVGCDLDLLCMLKPDINASNRFVLQTMKSKKFRFLSHQMFLANRTEQKEFLDLLSSILRICVPGTTSVKKILEAKVPIVKFFNTHTNMQCDLSSTNSIALHMTELLYIFSELDWRVRPLVCTIRKWAQLVQLTRDTPGQNITNFSLTLLIVFYLQKTKVLPSLDVIKRYIDEQVSSSQDTRWYEKWHKVRENDDLQPHDLLYGFFDYYSTFDFKAHAICINDAAIKMKADNSAVFICNPFDQLVNVSKNITYLELMRIVDYFRQATRIYLYSEKSDILLNLLKMKPNGLPAASNAFLVNKFPSDECDDRTKLVDKKTTAL